MYGPRPDRMQPSIPVISILHDHLDVPSIVISSACSIESMCVSGSTENVVLCAGTGNKNTDTTQHEHNSGAGRWFSNSLLDKLVICQHNNLFRSHSNKCFNTACNEFQASLVLKCDLLHSACVSIKTSQTDNAPIITNWNLYPNSRFQKQNSVFGKLIWTTLFLNKCHSVSFVLV